jgi:hypothetical protein
MDKQELILDGTTKILNDIQLVTRKGKLDSIDLVQVRL